MKHKHLSQGDQTVLQEDILYMARKVNDWQFFNPTSTPPPTLIKRISKNIHMHYNWRALAVHYNLNIPANLIHTFSPTQRIIWVMRHPYKRMVYPYKQQLGAHVIRNILTWMAVEGHRPTDELTDLELRYYNTIKEAL